MQFLLKVLSFYRCPFSMLRRYALLCIFLKQTERFWDYFYMFFYREIGGRIRVPCLFLQSFCKAKVKRLKIDVHRLRRSCIGDPNRTTPAKGKFFANLTILILFGVSRLKLIDFCQFSIRFGHWMFIKMLLEWKKVRLCPADFIVLDCASSARSIQKRSSGLQNEYKFY